MGSPGSGSSFLGFLGFGLFGSWVLVAAWALPSWALRAWVLPSSSPSALPSSLLSFFLLVLGLVADRDFIALGQERVLHIRAQRHGNQHLGVAVDEGRPQVVVQRRAEVAIAREEQVLPLAVERGGRGTELPVGDLLFVAGLEFVEPDRGDTRLVIRPFRVGDPGRVVRPARRESLRPRILVHRDGLAAVDRVQVHRAGLVGENNVLGVRGPGRRSNERPDRRWSTGASHPCRPTA